LKKDEQKSYGFINLLKYDSNVVDFEMEGIELGNNAGKNSKEYFKIFP
jgi:hypothetical protein